MIETLLRPMCEYKHRWFVVMSLTIITGFFTLIPVVEDYFEGKERLNALADSLSQAKLDVDHLGALEKDVQEISEVLESFENRIVSQVSMTTYRSRLVEVARETGCQVRKMTTGSVSKRPWKMNDDPLLETSALKGKDVQTGFELRRLPLSLSVTGSTSSLTKLLERMRQDDLLLHTKNVEIQSGEQAKHWVGLKLDLMFFDLVPVKKST